MDLYKILNINKNATLDTIKKTFRKLAQAMHPDTSNSEFFDKEDWEELMLAYSILSYIDKRKEYDETGSLHHGDNSGKVLATFNMLIIGLINKYGKDINDHNIIKEALDIARQTEQDSAVSILKDRELVKQYTTYNNSVSCNSNSLNLIRTCFEDILKDLNESINDNENNLDVLHEVKLMLLTYEYKLKLEEKIDN